MKRSFLIILIAVVGASMAYAAALDPLKIGLGARTIGMGRTAVAVKGINSIFANPANAAYLENYGFTSMQTNLSEDISYTFLGGAKPFNFGTLGLAYLSSGSSGFVVTSIEAGRVTATNNSFNYASSVLCLAYGKEIMENISVGSALKLYNKGFGGISGGSASGFDLDLGVLWQPTYQLTFGLSQQNTLPSSIAALNWGTGLAEGIPFNTKAGMTYLPDDNVLFALDLDYAAEAPLTFHAGVEYSKLKWVAFRGGIDQNSDTGPSMTGGVGLVWHDFHFDYAYFYDSLLADINSAHYFSFSYLPPLPIKPRLVKPKPVVELKVFSDVPQDYWARIPIGFLGGLGVIGGYPDGTFKPENTITRGELALMLAKAKGVSPEAISSPKRKITRAEGVQLIARFDNLEMKMPNISPYKDVRYDTWMAPAVAAAKKAGLLDYLKGRNFEPNRPLTRTEVAEMLYRTRFVKNLLPMEDYETTETE